MCVCVCVCVSSFFFLSLFWRAGEMLFRYPNDLIYILLNAPPLLLYQKGKLFYNVSL